MKTSIEHRERVLRHLEMSARSTETVALPVDGFVLLIKSAAQAVINEMSKPTSGVNVKFLHEQIGFLDELIGKFENLQHRESE